MHCRPNELRPGSQVEPGDKYQVEVLSDSPVLRGAPSRAVLEAFNVRRHLCVEMERRIRLVANHLGVRAPGPTHNSSDSPGTQLVRILPCVMRHVRVNYESISGSGLWLRDYLPRLT